MDSKNRYVVIPLAWPDTMVSGVGEWYERLFISLGIIKNPVYRVGHAAFIVLDQEENSFRYFDFGRYETEKGYGRVRNANSDPELHIDSFEHTRMEDVLNLLSKKRSTHGEGKLFAVKISKINGDKLERILKRFEEEKVHPYSPYRFYDLNCSRFVNYVLAHSSERLFHRAFLKVFPAKYLLTGAYLRFLSRLYGENMQVIAAGDDVLHSKTVSNEIQENLIKEGYQLLEGIGASSWFKLEETAKNLYSIERKDDLGVTNFCFPFTLTNTIGFDISRAYNFSYPCDAVICTIVQNQKKFTFRRSVENATLHQSPKEMPNALAVSIK